MPALALLLALASPAAGAVRGVRAVAPRLHPVKAPILPALPSVAPSLSPHIALPQAAAPDIRISAPQVQIAPKVGRPKAEAKDSRRPKPPTKKKDARQAELSAVFDGRAREGSLDHLFVVDPGLKVMGHAVTDARSPRYLAALAQGNSGALIRFRGKAKLKTLQGSAWRKGRQRGLRTVLQADKNRLALSPEDVMLDSMRQIREVLAGEEPPAEYRALAEAAGRLGEKVPPPDIRAYRKSGDALVLTRRNAAGRLHRVELKALNGTVRRAGPEWVFEAAERLKLEVTASNDLPPLTPLTPDQLWRPGRETPGLAGRVLAFKEKFLAGSYRFLTYFGRDSLITAMILEDDLSPRARETVVRSVLERLSPEGRVAHEEDVEDRAVLERVREFLRLEREGRTEEARALLKGRRAWRRPIYDYRMVDDDFLLAPLALRLIRARDIPPEDKRAFWLARNASGETNLRSLLRNWEFVLRRAARGPVPLPAGQRFGNWRDSNEGLAEGRYPGDVNGALIPAALEAVARSAEALADLLGPEALAGAARGLARVREDWERLRARFFVRRRLADMLKTAAAWSAKREPGLMAQEALPGRTLADLAAAPDVLAEIEYLTLAADGTLRPDGILNSDGIFRLHLEDLSDAEFARALLPFFLPYPLGLWTDVGPLVSSAVHGRAASWREKAELDAYHVRVVWGWVERALKAALLRRAAAGGESARLWLGLRRELARAERRAGRLAGSELRRAAFRDGRWRAEPYAGDEGNKEPSNPAQLWSQDGSEEEARRVERMLGPLPRRSRAALTGEVLVLSR